MLAGRPLPGVVLGLTQHLGAWIEWSGSEHVEPDGMAPLPAQQLPEITGKFINLPVLQFPRLDA